MDLLLFASIVGYLCVLAVADFGNNLADRWGHAALMKLFASAQSDGVTISLDGASIGSEKVIDVGRWLLPSIDAPWLSDTVLLSIFICFAISVLLADKAKDRSRSTRRQRALHFMWCHAAVLAIRFTTVLATVNWPSPACLDALRWRQVNGVSMPGDVAEYGVGLLMNRGCFDMQLSGHCSTALLLARATHGMLKSGRHRWLVAIAYVLAAAEYVANIAVGDHYSVDVLLALYVPLLIERVVPLPAYFEEQSKRTHALERHEIEDERERRQFNAKFK
jgi:PAP2 superfamily C-terminal